ncbi:MAG: 8-amino-7-oxononanoate synthase [Porticoccaceae bacterium]|nr:MAG: 8-amino-7-oxononanoate synthase [Porticoccaceae bacterium]
MSATLPAPLVERLRRHRAAGLERSRWVVDGAQGVRLRLGDRTYLSFASNDYLGLAADGRLAAALAEAARRVGVGAGASHLIAGHHREHQALEEALAAFTGRERALLYSSGFQANLGVIAALAGAGDLVVEDRLNHASLLDGALLARARLRRYPHRDAAAAGRLLAGRGGAKLLVTDGVFSMDGDLAPLPELARVARQQGAVLVVDDAHGLGVLGRTGRGVVEHFALDAASVPVLVGTLGKAFGTAGAFVAGSAELVDYLIQFSRPYVYTTAHPPALAAASRAALAIAAAEGWRRERLSALVARFRQGAAQQGVPLADSTTPIQPVLLGGEARCLAVAERLRAAGILVGAIRPPTVPRGTARLRIALSAAHREEDVDRLLEALGAALDAVPGEEET